MRYQEYLPERTVESERRRTRFNPHFTIWVAIPIILGSLFVLYYAAQAIGWMHDHWPSAEPWVIAAAILAAIGALIRPIWKVYQALHKHHQESLDRNVLRNLATETVYLLQAARENNHVVKISGNANSPFPNIEVSPLLQAAARRREQVLISEADEAPLLLSGPQNDQRALPTVVRYEDISHQIPRGQALLGVGAHGSVETCDFAQLMTMWICGGSSTGKSNTVALKIDEAIRNGRNITIILIDPHARKDDSLYNKIRCYESRFLCPAAVEEEEILHVLQWFYAEYKRRLAAGGADNDILLVVDEVSNVVESEDEEIGKLIKKIARICGQESRGFGMFGWFISQNATGVAWLRKMALTVIVHKMVMMSERKIACNEDTSLARSMDYWPRGRIAVYGASFDEGTRVFQMAAFNPPPFVDADSATAFASAPTAQLDQMEELQPKTQPVSPAFRAETLNRSAETPSRSGDEAPFEADADDHKIIPLRASENLAEPGSKKKIQSASDVSDETKKIIVRMAKKMPLREIAPLVGLGGDYYPIFKQVCQELGIKQQQKGAEESEAL